MNGRELTADDVVFNFHRFTGLGSGFTEKSPAGSILTSLPIASIEATDKLTVEIKLTQTSFTALDVFLYDSFDGGWIYPPEVIKEHGNVQDWRNLVGTGPYELVDWVEGSSLTYTRNPNYWAFDEKFPENRLPYADELNQLTMRDPVTRMAALRTGKLAILDELSRDDVESLQRTDPELVITNTIRGGSNTSSALDVRQPPFDDIRVRQAMQLAIDIEAINQGLYGGLALTTPMGAIGTAALGFYVPFEEWPEEVKANYGYDPERAERLLDEAGYPRGADGTRFKTTYMTTTTRGDIEYTQIAKDYWAQIGVDVYHDEDLEIEEVMETPEVGPGDLLLLRVNTIHATQSTDDRRVAVSLRTCDPATPIDWHRVAGSPTMAKMQRLGGFRGNAAPNKLYYPVFQATQENDFGITLADVLPTLTGERE